MEAEWIFPSHEIQITEEILGRGAYGEVRVGRWRDIDVACKRLHPVVAGSSVDAHAVLEGMKQEMEILSRLRHPNLVLFLGVCTERTQENSATVVPTVILTELMPCSLYDILEVHKVVLSLPEILDIALDIAHGLQYLHSHIPTIVHRDISSKNVLIGGNKAKIADLGQAKIFGSSLMSRQTSLPGAMAYSAPEVLTGKYTGKIDIFSFGVLLMQLSTGQYPRIEKREEQLEQACAKYPPLAQLVTCCVAFHPDSRPTAAEVCTALSSVKSNDRFYPAERRLPPLSDLGVMARKWMSDHMDDHSRELNLKYESASKQLRAEEIRWREEATRVDQLQRKLVETEDVLQTTKSSLDQKTSALEESKRSVDVLEERLESATAKLSRLEADKRSKEETINELEVKNHLQDVQLEDLQRVLLDQEKVIDELRGSITSLKNAEQRAADRERDTKVYLDMQVDQNRELESRLEQALSRWKQERELCTQETEKYLKMKSMAASVSDALDKTRIDNRRLSARLGQYDNLPLPDEIRARMKDMTADLERCSNEIIELTTQRDELQEHNAVADNTITGLRSDLFDRDTQITQKNAEIGERDRINGSLQSRLMAVDQELRFLVMKNEEFEAENAAGLGREEQLKTQLKEAEKLIEQQGIRMQMMHADNISNANSAAGSNANANAATRSSNMSGGTSRGGGRNRGGGGGGGTAASRGGSATGLLSSSSHNNLSANNQEESSNRGHHRGVSAASTTVSTTVAVEGGGRGGGGGGGHRHHNDDILGDLVEGEVEHDDDVVSRSSSRGGQRRRRIVQDGGDNDNDSNNDGDDNHGGGDREEENPDSVVDFDSTRQLMRGGGGGDANNEDEDSVSMTMTSSMTWEEKNIVMISALAERKRQDDEVRGRVLEISEQKGIPGLIEALAEEIEDDQMCWRVPRALRELVVRDESLRKKCLSLQCDDLLLQALQKHPDSTLVQGQALRLLGTLVFGNDQIRRKCGDKGVVRTIAQTLERHSEDETVILHACTLLTNLLYNSFENRTKFLESSGVEILVGQMDRHRSSSRLQRQACWALLTLAASDEMSRAVVMAGGASAITNALLDHSGDAGVQQFGCWALSNLALAGDDIRRRLKKMGVTEICRIAIEAHNADAEVVRQAKNLLGVVGPAITGRGVSAIAADKTRR